MSKQELISALAELSGVTKADTARVLNALASHVQGELYAGRDVSLTGIGKIKAVKRSARTGRNPKTGEAVQIPAKRTAKLVVSQSLKDAIN